MYQNPQQTNDMEAQGCPFSQIHFAQHHVTSLNVVHGGAWRCLLFGRRTLGARRGLVAAATVVTLYLLAEATGLLLQAGMDLTAALSPENIQAVQNVSIKVLSKFISNFRNVIQFNLKPVHI